MPRLAAAALALCLLSSAGAAESDLQISRAGTRSLSPAPAQNFSGAATVEMLRTPAGPDRTSVGTVIALNRPEQLRSHLVLGRNIGLSKDEMVEALTHLAFYTGWPNAVSAAGVAREVFATKP